MADFGLGKYEITFREPVDHSQVVELHRRLLPLLEELDIEVASMWAEIRLPE